MPSDLLLALWEGLLASSTGALGVLLLRRPWSRWFGATSTPVLWLLVPLAMAAVWLPGPIVSAGTDWQMMTTPAVPQVANAVVASAPSAIAEGSWLLWVWAAGSLLATLHFLVLQRRFRRRLGHLRRIEPGVLLASRSDAGPAVLGVLRPQIVLPADFHQRYSREEQILILAHERSHQRRGDVLANAIATGLRCLYWFNPLLHYAADRLRHDHELASDADVVLRYPHARRRYADTLLNVQLAVPGLPVGCLWQSSHPLKERILMLSTARSTPHRRRLGVALALGVSLTAATLAWANQTPRLQTDAPSWTSQKVTLKAKQHSLRQAVEALAREAGIAVAGGELLDRVHPQADIDFEFDDTQAGAMFEALLADSGVQYAFNERGLLLAAGDTSASKSTAVEEPTYRAIRPPRYPQTAIDAKQSGSVVLRVSIDTEGLPAEVVVASATAPGVFDEAAIAAVKTWKFNPSSKDGIAQPSEVLVPVCFSMDEQQPDCPGPDGALDGIYLKPPAGDKKG